MAVFLEMYAAALLALVTREAVARARAWACPAPSYATYDSDGSENYATL